MPDLLAGTTILAGDTPPERTAFVEDDESSISSTTFVAGSVPCGTPFMACTTGRVEVAITCRIQTPTTNNRLFVSLAVYEDDAGGSQVRPASSSDTHAGNRGIDSLGVYQTLSALIPVDGLTPYGAYFAQVEFRVDGGSSAIILSRLLRVRPAS